MTPPSLVVRENGSAVIQFAAPIDARRLSGQRHLIRNRSVRFSLITPYSPANLHAMENSQQAARGTGTRSLSRGRGRGMWKFDSLSLGMPGCGRGSRAWAEPQSLPGRIVRMPSIEGERSASLYGCGGPGGPTPRLHSLPRESATVEESFQDKKKY